MVLFTVVVRVLFTVVVRVLLSVAEMVENNVVPAVTTEVRLENYAMATLSVNILTSLYLHGFSWELTEVIVVGTDAVVVMIEPDTVTVMVAPAVAPAVGPVTVTGVKLFGSGCMLVWGVDAMLVATRLVTLLLISTHCS